MQAQAAANAQTQRASIEAEARKQQIVSETAITVEKAKADMDLEKLMQEAQIKKELMALEFEFNMQLKSGEVQGMRDREKEKEDRKDRRTKLQATQQSELIDQRNNNKPPKDFERPEFESAGNDVLGGIDMSQFGPR
jgi:hypothetical protein